MDDNERDEQERPRPRVVDKRVTARKSVAPVPHDAPDRAPPDESPQVEPPPAPDIPPRGEDTARAPESSGRPPVWTPDQEEDARRMVEEIRRVPSTDWVLSSVMTLVNVASVKLESGDNEGAQLAIDALSGIVDAVGGRLAENEAPLRQVVTQLKMAYAQAMTPGAPAGPAPGP